MSLRFYPDRCTGCMACQMACLDQRDVRPMEGQRPLLRVEQTEKGGILSFRMIRCTQCGQCAQVCPTGCLHRGEDGIIHGDGEQCVGCGACLEACPLGVIALDADTKSVKKCDACMGRVEAGLLPACVHTCPNGALEWEETSDEI